MKHQYYYQISLSAIINSYQQTYNVDWENQNQFQLSEWISMNESNIGSEPKLKAAVGLRVSGDHKIPKSML